MEGGCVISNCYVGHISSKVSSIDEHIEQPYLLPLYTTIRMASNTSCASMPTAMINTTTRFSLKPNISTVSESESVTFPAHITRLVKI